MSNVIAIDPGKMSGIAEWDSRVPDICLNSELPAMPLLSYIELEAASLGDDLTVVYERYDITGETVKKSRQYDALYIIGTLKYLTWHHGARITGQSRSDRKIVTDARLKALGWYRPTPGGHSNDAARHLGRYLAGQRLLTLPV